MSEVNTVKGEGPQKPFFNFFVGATQNIWAENRLLRVIALLAFLSSMVFTVVVFRTIDQVKTVIVPFGQGTESLYIVGDKPSEGYLVSISNNIVALGGTYTASGAKFQFDELLKLVHPSKHADLKKKFRTNVDNLERYPDISFATFINYDQRYRFEDGVVKVPVRRNRFIGTKRHTEGGFVVISYLVEGSRFWLTNLEFQKIGEARSVQLED